MMKKKMAKMKINVKMVMKMWSNKNHNNLKSNKK